MLSYVSRTFHRKKITIAFFFCAIILIILFGRLVYLMIARADYYAERAEQLHERERSIKAARGKIVDRNGVVIADNKSVCTISVIHSQIEDSETVIKSLCNELNLSDEYVRKRVMKNTSIERVKSNVDKETGDRIRNLRLSGVKVDEDYKRYYPYGTLGSKVLGFTGSDNQGIIGLEVIYEDILKGQKGMILTVTDAKGIEIKGVGEERLEPENGDTLHTSIDINIQSYATQLAKQAMETKEAEGVSIIVMNPQDGEILAMVSVPEFDLNNPYELPSQYYNSVSQNDFSNMSEKEKQNILNGMWRNNCINDTYEPGSIFKIVTAAAGLESDVVTPQSTFSCPGYIIVGDRRIRCHKVSGHGAEDFVKGTMNSCNPVFITVGLRIGAERFYNYFIQFGLLQKTGIDLPGEANTIMHKLENIKEVELATMSFGQSFQVTPIQMITTAASIVNGGRRIIPHFGVSVENEETGEVRSLEYQVGNQILSSETSATMREILEKVVSEGGGKNAYIEGVKIGGKTATSQTLPRGTGKYISSFVGFAPADHPQIIAIAIINHPKGTYYGGLIAAPIVRQLFENILPYLEIMDYNELSNLKSE